jgi:hypothetical protein
MKIGAIRGSLSVGVWVARLLGTIALFLTITTIPALAQSSSTILGVVKDTSGGSVPDATVTITSVETNSVRTATTGADGEYRVPGLQPGHYNVKVEKSGFKTENQTGLTLDVTQEITVNASLEIGSSTQEVTVTGEAPLVNTQTSALSGLVDDQKVAELPLNGRNFVDLALLQPGVTNDTNFQNANATTSGAGVWGTIYSSNGAPIRSNTAMLDGALMNNFHGNVGGATGATLGVDGIKEFRVITSAFSAEYGLQMGSQTVIVSKSGTNQFHGDVFEYLRNKSMDARNFFDYSYLTTGDRIPQLQRNDFGGSFGGPIKKDKTFFYGVFEGLRQRQGLTIIDNVPSEPSAAFPTLQNCHLAVGNPCATLTSSGLPMGTVAPSELPFLALYPAPNLPGNQFTFPATAPTALNYGQLRVDQTISANDSFFGRYTVQDSFTNAAFVFPQFTFGSNGRDQFLTLSENHVFSPTVLNTVRASFSRTNIAQTTSFTTSPIDLSAPPYQFIAGQPMGQLQITGISTIGPNSSSPNFLIQNVYTVSDDVFYTRGRHAFKFGTLINRFEDNDEAFTNRRGSIVFGSLAAFLAGEQTSGTFLTPQSNINKFVRNYTFGFYAQDDVRVTSRVTLNLGLRYEFSTEPIDRFGNNWAVIGLTNPSVSTGTNGKPFQDPYYHNFSPRVGIAWDVTGNGKTSVRASFGDYYDIANSAFTLYSAQATPPISANYAPPQFGTPGAPTTPFTFPVSFTVSTGLHTQDYFLHAPHLLQWNLSVEHQFTPTTELSVAFVGTRGIHLWDNEEGNNCVPTSITNGIPFWATNCGARNVDGTAVPNTLQRVNQNFGSTNFETTNADSQYQALQVVLTKRVSHGLQIQGAYTWGRVTDDVQGQFGPSDCQAAGGSNTVYTANKAYTDKGPACFDVKDSLHASVLYHLPTLTGKNALERGALGGWWLGSLINWQSGFYFTPMTSGWISNSSHLNGSNANGTTDHASLNTVAFTGPIYTGASVGVLTKGTAEAFVPYNSATVITGNPQQWYNPLMFNAGTTGFLGTAGRDILEGPHMSDVDLSINKDTPLHMLGEQGALQFRAEFFNILNHANFGIPNGTALSGTTNNVSSTAGQITYTVTTARQIQLSLKVVF